MQNIWEKCTDGGCLCKGVQLVVIVLLLALCCSCATRTTIEYRDRDVNHYITKYVHDTLRVETKDSIHHEVIVKGDTVYDTKFVYRTLWRERVVEKTDTCWRDSVVTEYKENTKEIVKYPKSYWYLLAFSIIFGIFAIIKLVRWLQTL